MHTSYDTLGNSEKHDSMSRERNSEKAKTEATAQRQTSETRPPHRIRWSGRSYHMTLHHPMRYSHESHILSCTHRRVQARFFSNEQVACPRGETNLRTRQHILTECPRYKDRVTLPTPCMTSSSHLIHLHSPSFLTVNLHKIFKSGQIQPIHPQSTKHPGKTRWINSIHTTKRLLVKDPSCLPIVPFSFFPFFLLSICVF